MALSAIKITRDQREAIYQAVRTHLVGLSDVFTLLERRGDVPGAERLARDFADDFRLLEDRYALRTLPAMGWGPRVFDHLSILDYPTLREGAPRQRGFNRETLRFGGHAF